VGQVLVILVLASLTYAIIEGPGRGWASPLILGLFALAALSLAGLVRYEPRREDPLIDLRFFRSIPFSGATVIAVCAFISLAGFLFLNTLYLQDVRGYSAMKAGLLTLPMAVVTAVFGPLSGRLVAERGSRPSLMVSGLFIGATGLLFQSLSATTSLVYLGVVYALFGLGFGVVNAPITNTAVSGMPRSQSGVAAAVASTSRQVGQSLGVALIGTVAVAQVHGSMREGFSAASHLGWAILAGCGLIILVLGVFTTTRRATQSAEEAAVLFPDHSGLTAPPARIGTSAADAELLPVEDAVEDGVVDAAGGALGFPVESAAPTRRTAADASPDTDTR
jgi:hypothetical protein